MDVLRREVAPPGAALPLTATELDPDVDACHRERGADGVEVDGNRLPGSKDLHLADGDTATVQLEVSRQSGDLWTGTSTDQVAVSLVRQADGWRIMSTDDPFPWQFQ